MNSARSGMNGSSGRVTGRSEQGPDTRGRAELFEDEKRRIIESCFNKTEDDGAFAESYITHISVEEDGSSPSSPPPPDSAAQNKKPRVIIVAVRRSGRVRLHKARENSNSSFSIGKTWLLENLSVIESFSGGQAFTAEERQRKSWGGERGMLITILKPYFWKAQSVKEKDFFVGSLVKIYRKYTGGKEPQLLGFSSAELAEIGPLTSQQPAPPQMANRQSPAPSPALKTGGTDFSASGQPPDSASLPIRPASSGASSMRTMESAQDRMPPLPGQFPSETPRSLRGQDKIRSRNSQGESYTGSDSLRPPSRDIKSRGLDPSSSTESFHSSRPTAPTPPVLSSDRFRSNAAYSPLSRAEKPPEIPEPGPRSPERNNTTRRAPSSTSTQETLPERRRPPLSGDKWGSAPSDDMPSPLEPRKTSVNDSTGESRRDRTEDTSKVDESTRTANDDDMSRSGDVAAALSSLTSPLSPPPEPDPEPEQFRPGLGPMIKKRSAKDIATQFRKAAMAANAFKPRAGGAAERLRTEAGKQNNASDGINGVFKAPIIAKDALRSPPPSTPDGSVQTNPIDAEMTKKDSISSIAAADTRANSVPQADGTKDAKPTKEQTPEPPAPAPEERKKKRPTDTSARFAESLGISHRFLEGRTAEIEALFDDIGWSPEERKTISSEVLLNNCRKEVAKAETGTWISCFEQGDDRVSQLGGLLDKAITECDELDGLLTLYDAELATLNEDVGYIEAQSQGLQVQAANIRLLYQEQKKLLDTITIPTSQLRVLSGASLSQPDEIASVESALGQLFNAMLTIDPSLRHQNRAGFADTTTNNESSGNANKISNEVSNMRAVQEKKDGYRAESVDFILRFKSHMSNMFRESEAAARQSIDKERHRPATNVKIDLRRRDYARSQLWVYAPLMLFTREIDQLEWDGILKMYEHIVKQPYQDEYRECFSMWKQVAKKPTGDELDILFTKEEKENDSLVGRKLTVKRSKTLREGPRVPSVEKAQEGKISAYEAFAGVLYDTTQSIASEQNFCSDLFQMSSAGTSDFTELISITAPESRRGGDLSGYRQFDPDRNLAKRLQNMMEDIYSFWPSDLHSLIEQTLAQDPVQGVGVLCALESKYSELEDSNQEFILHVLKQNRDRLATRFERFIDEQIRGIEDTKVRIKKRKGVIAFIKTFPYFSSTVENMLPSPRTDAFEVRDMVNHAYRRLAKAMFESLKFIAKESPVVMAGQKSQGQGTGDTEDKEVLNYHILIIENMNHYVEEVDVRNNSVLEESKREAAREMAEHMSLYLNAVLRRPLSKLLDSLESTESQVASAAAIGDSPTAVAAKASHSKAIFKKVLSTNDAKEIRHGVEALKKRVEKHFGNADDPGLSRNLVVKVLRECEDRYADVLGRVQKIVRDVYEGQLEVEFKKEDISNAFRK